MRLLAVAALTIAAAACSEESPEPCETESSSRCAISDDDQGVELGVLTDTTTPPVPDSTKPDLRPEAPVPYVHEDITPQQFRSWQTQGKVLVLVDVREPSEFAEGHIEGAINLPLTSGVLEAEHGTLPSDKPIVVYCRSGRRSDIAAKLLEGEGFQPIYDLGGINDWTAAGYPIVK